MPENIKNKPGPKPKKRGPKPKITKATIDKLETVFALDGTDQEACLHANISPATLYNYQKSNPEFLERKGLLKHKSILAARISVVNGLKTDANLALKYLEKKRKDEFASRQEHVGKDGDAIENNMSIIYYPNEYPDDFYLRNKTNNDSK